MIFGLPKKIVINNYMSIITLTTDFGLKDYFVGVLKVQIISKISEATIIDLSHNIDPFNHTEASYILASSIHHFPDNTIHLIGVDSQVSLSQHYLLVYYKNQYFITVNNGIMSMVMADDSDFLAYRLDNHDDTMPSLSFFVEIASKIASGIKPDSLGKPIKELKQVITINPIVSNYNNEIITSVIYIDGLENLIFNLKKSQFESIAQNRKFRIMTKPRPITKIYSGYGDALIQHKDNKQALEGNQIAIFNEADHLEIGVFLGNPNSSGSAHSLSGLNYFDTLKIIFE